MPKGGARKGAGRKPLPLHVKLMREKEGGQPLKKVRFNTDNAMSATPPEYLKIMRKQNEEFAHVPTPMDIYHNTVKYLEPSDCLPLIPQEVLSDYVMAKYYLLCAQAELAVTPFVGKVSQKRGDDGVLYPVYKTMDFTDAVLKLQKNVLACWSPIWEIVSKNSERMITNPEEDLIAMMVTARYRKSQKGVSHFDTKS